MKTWNQIKIDYKSFLHQKGLKQPERRISALKKIEEYIRTTHPSVLKGYTLFTTLGKDDLKRKFEIWKGNSISGAESQVINDFYKLAMK